MTEQQAKIWLSFFILTTIIFILLNVKNYIRYNYYLFPTNKKMYSWREILFWISDSATFYNISYLGLAATFIFLFITYLLSTIL